MCLHFARSADDPARRRVRVPAGCPAADDARQFDARRVRARPARHALCGQRGRRQFSSTNDATLFAYYGGVRATAAAGVRARLTSNVDFLIIWPGVSMASCRPSVSRSSPPTLGRSAAEFAWRRHCGSTLISSGVPVEIEEATATGQLRPAQQLPNGQTRLLAQNIRRRAISMGARGNGGGRGRAGPRRSAVVPRNGGARWRRRARGDGPGRVPGHGRAVPAPESSETLSFPDKKKRRRGRLRPGRLRRRRRLRPRSTRSSWSESGPPSSSPPRRPSRRLSRTTRTRSTRTTTPSSTSRKSSDHNRGSARRVEHEENE